MIRGFNEKWRKAAATKLAMPLQLYDTLVAHRVKWCSGCRAWHPATIEVFGVCQAKTDGLNTICKAWRALYDAVRRAKKTERLLKLRATWVRKERVKMGMKP